MPQFERIVVGTDYSESSGAALRHASYLARQSDADLHLVHVVSTFGDNPLVEAHRSSTDEEELTNRLVDESDRLMQEFLETYGDRSVRIKCVHARGLSPYEVLLDYADREEADLMVLGTHGRKGIRRLFLGSVAAKILAASKIPVMVVRTAPDGPSLGSPVHRILVPVDLSRASISGVHEAHRLAQLYHASLELLHVIEPYVLPVSLTGIKTLRDLVPDIEDRIRSHVTEIVEGLQGPYIPTRTHIREGNAAQTVVEMAEEQKCDMIVAARSGMTSSERFVLGSVTEKISRITTIPLYVVPVSDRLDSSVD